MFCSKCGNKLPDNAIFCPKCGHKVGTSPNSAKEKLSDLSDKVVDEISEGVESVSSEVKNVTEEVSSGFKNVQDKASETLNDASESIKNFQFSDLLTKKYADLGSAITALAPVLLILLNVVILTIVSGLLLGVFEELIWTIGIGGALGEVIYIIRKAIFIIVSIFGYLALAISFVTLGVLVYRVAKFNETDNANIFQLIATVISIVALFGFVIARVSFLRWFGILPFIFGIDFFIVSVMKKEEIRGNIDLAGDINYVKELRAQSKEKAQEEKAQETVNQNTTSEPVEVTIVSDPNGESSFDGTGGELFVNNLLLVLVSLITCGLATPFMLVKIKKWEKEHTIINGQRLIFNGTGTQLWGLWIKWWFLSVITCGIYSYFATVDYYKWLSKHTAYEGTDAVNAIYPESHFEGNSFEYLGYSILTGVVTGATCGIAYPWMECIILRWQYKNTVVNSEKLKFECTGGKLFGTYIVVALLNIITCGLYSAWGTCKINRLLISHVHVDK